MATLEKVEDQCREAWGSKGSGERQNQEGQDGAGKHAKSFGLSGKGNRVFKLL